AGRGVADARIWNTLAGDAAVRGIGTRSAVECPATPIRGGAAFAHGGRAGERRAAGVAGAHLEARAGVRMSAGVAGAVALVAGASVSIVATGRRGCLLGVGGTVGRGPGAHLGKVALPGRSPAGRPPGDEGIGRATHRAPGAVLGNVAWTRRSPTERPA